MPQSTDQRVLFDSSSSLPSTVIDEESVGQKDIAKLSKNVRKSNTPPAGAIATPKTEASEVKKGPSSSGGNPVAASGDMLDSKSWLKNFMKDEGIVLGSEPPEVPDTSSDLEEKEGDALDNRAKASEALETKGEWSAYFDAENTGLIYYFNSITGESQWNPPSSTFPKVPFTKEMRQISQQRQDEYIQALKLKQMEKERSTIASRQVAQAPLATVGSWQAFWDKEDTGYVYYHNTATGMSQWTPPKLFPKFQKREGMKVAKPAVQAEKLARDGDWSAYFDIESALIYYFNNFTGKSRWEKPSTTFPSVQLTESMQEAVCAKDDVLKRKRRGPVGGLIGTIFGRKSHETRHKNPVMNWFLTRFASESEEETRAAPSLTLWGSIVQWFEETAAFWDGLGKEPKEGSIE